MRRKISTIDIFIVFRTESRLSVQERTQLRVQRLAQESLPPQTLTTHDDDTVDGRFHRQTS